MKVRINNTETETQSVTLHSLAEELNLPAKGIAVAINNQMIPRDQWHSTPLQEQANILIIKAVCGG